MTAFQDFIEIAEDFAKAEVDLSAPEAREYVRIAFHAVNSARVDAAARFVKARTSSAREKAKADSDRAKALAEDIRAAWDLVTEIHK